MPNLTHSDFSAVADLFGSANDSQEDTSLKVDYVPGLGKTQMQIFKCKARYILAHGERGTGKTYGFLHKGVSHCVNNFNALVLVVVGVKSQATQGGAWHKLKTEILPQWKDEANLIHTEEHMDEQRNRYIDVQNKFGGASRIVLISLPWGIQVADRIRGFEPSMVFVDELTTLMSPDYFDAVTQQLGRRPGIDDPQQYCGATNPDGPTHWVYKRFFEVPMKTGKWNRRYAVFHVPFKENQKHMPKDYRDQVLEATSEDETLRKRMLEGEWIDRPSGEAIFADSFSSSLHVFGDMDTRITPYKDLPVFVGYDLGIANNAIVFMQPLHVNGRMKWTVFDEMIYIDRRIAYDLLVPNLMRRMKLWQTAAGGEISWVHYSDDSAFKFFRPNSGSYDVMDIQRRSREVIKDFPGLIPLKIKAAPKFSGSVERRVQILAERFSKEEVVISKHCPRLIAMAKFLESDPKKGGFTPKRSQYLHGFDALTYPLLAYYGGNRRSKTASPTVIIEMAS